MKKIRGSIYYFGTWAKRENGKLVRVEGDGWKEALEPYKAQADDVHAGRTPRANSDGLTFGELRARFLTAGACIRSHRAPFMKISIYSRRLRPTRFIAPLSGG
jgi:hypothetical protein